MTELDLETATLVAFGSTRRPAGKVDVDPTLQALVEAGTSTACIVGKSWDFHVTEALGTTLDEGVAMVGESVDFLVKAGLRVFFDAEHFFDGYKANPEYTLRVLEAAAVNGADCLVMCDTNGGSLPHEVQHIVGEVHAYFGADQQLGIHTQNDSGCAVANSVAAVVAGATQLQGTVNGYGERTGNANLMTCIPNLELKMGVRCLPEGRLARLTAVSRHVAELVNLPPHAADPYVGQSAFAHKGGLHTSALGKAGGATYEHIEPGLVGNGTRVLVSDLGGRAGMVMKAKELGVDLDDRAAGRLSRRPEAAGGGRVRVRGGRRQPRAADAPGHRLGPGVVPGGGLPRHHVPPGAGGRGVEARDRHRGHGQGVGRRRAAHRGGGGQRPRQRPGPGAAARAGRRLPAARPHPPHRLPRADPRHRRRHRRGGAGAHRLHRRRAGVDHHRRLHQHHRGVAGRP